MTATKVTKIAKVGYADRDHVIIYMSENARMDMTLINKKIDLSGFHNTIVKVTIEVIREGQ